MRDGNAALLALDDQFFNAPEVQVLELKPEVVEKATELRARFEFRTPDSLHLASAITAGARSFLTGDQDLRRCTEIPVEVL